MFKAATACIYKEHGKFYVREGQRDSNSGSFAYQAAALTNESMKPMFMHKLLHII